MLGVRITKMKEHIQKLHEYMVVNAKCFVNALRVAVGVQEIVHPINASERAGMVGLLEKKMLDTVHVGKEDVSFKCHLSFDPSLSPDGCGRNNNLALPQAFRVRLVIFRSQVVECAVNLPIDHAVVVVDPRFIVIVHVVADSVQGSFKVRQQQRLGPYYIWQGVRPRSGGSFAAKIGLTLSEN